MQEKTTAIGLLKKNILMSFLETTNLKPVSKMKKNKISSISILFFIISLIPSFVLANTGSTELSPVLTFLQDNLNGIVGKIIVITAVLIAVINSVIKFNGYVVAGCVGTALFAFYGDNFLIGLFGSLI